MARISPSSFSGSLPLVLRAGVLLAAALLLAACGSQATHTSHSNHATTDPTPRVPAFINNVAEARPLPAALDPRQFSDPAVVKAYTYAGQNPEIFAQQPCYCYCDAGEGHKSLLDCFATTHGVSCPLCLKEGLLVHKLVNEGKNATEIRELINRKEWQDVKLE
mgnify:CR=1 FL=1